MLLKHHHNILQPNCPPHFAPTNISRQQSLRAGCITGQIYTDYCGEAREMLRPLELDAWPCLGTVENHGEQGKDRKIWWKTMEKMMDI